jgi:hypothetical protein
MLNAIQWLLSGEPWVEYPVRAHLLGEDTRSPAMRELYGRMERHPLVAGVLAELAGWEGCIVSNHKNAALPYHKLDMLAGMGLTAETPAIAAVIEIILRHREAHGVPQAPINVPRHFGGTGADTWGWALCDAPVVLDALLALGVEERLLEGGIAHLAGLARANGWPCAVSAELGKFRGPGRKDDPCPYATLRMVKLLQRSRAWRASPAAKAGAEAILGLWERSREEHPYMFYMGTDFRKLKAPLSWYDIAGVAGALSLCPWLHDDKRYVEMLESIMEKADEKGRFTPESVYLSMKGWDFGQKKEPSKGLTAQLYRLLKRSGITVS